MSEYTYEELIINPTSEKARNYVGKEVYFSDNINICLYRANHEINSFMGVLQGITERDSYPFRVNDSYYQVIIPKKEEPKPEYIPFSNPDEFIDAYISNLDKRMDIGAIHKLDKFGMWIKYKDDYVLVTYIEASGINFGTQMEADWQDLCDNYTFLDGTPCGKPKEVK